MLSSLTTLVELIQSLGICRVITTNFREVLTTREEGENDAKHCNLQYIKTFLALIIGSGYDFDQDQAQNLPPLLFLATRASPA